MPDSPDASSNPPPASLLLAEDSPVIRDAIRALLLEAGHAVQTVEDGEAAWTLLSEDKIVHDLLILDLEIPLVDGWELVRRLRSRESGRGVGRRLPILVISGRVDASVLKAGADAWLRKPFYSAELLEKVTRLLAASRPGRTEE